MNLSGGQLFLACSFSSAAENGKLSFSTEVLFVKKEIEAGFFLL